MSFSLIVLLWVCGSVVAIGAGCLRAGYITLYWTVMAAIYSWVCVLLIGLWIVIRNWRDPVIWRSRE